ncbi:MAG: hypothetical protein Q8O67_31420 [Deltaproteobacteria bacterium]|nr:hypothetical protein [Deltaproteobacteria bacterium]
MNSSGIRVLWVGGVLAAALTLDACNCGVPFVSLVGTDGVATRVAAMPVPDGRAVHPGLVARQTGGFVVAATTPPRVGLCLGIICTDDISLLVLGAWDDAGAQRWTFTTAHNDAPGFVTLRALTTLGGGEIMVVAHCLGNAEVRVDDDDVALPQGHFVLVIDDDGAAIAVRALPALDADEFFFERVFLAPLGDGALLVQGSSVDRNVSLVSLDARGEELRQLATDISEIDAVEVRSDGAVAVLSRGVFQERQPGDEEARTPMQLDIVTDTALETLERIDLIDAVAQFSPRIAFVDDGGFVLADMQGPSQAELTVERRGPGQEVIWSAAFPAELTAGKLMVLGDHVVLAGPFFGDPEAPVEVGDSVVGGNEDTRFVLVLSLATGGIVHVASAPMPTDSSELEAAAADAAVVGDRVVVMGAF